MTSPAPLEIGRRLRLVVPGTPPGGDSRIEVTGPRGAFGSGEHETTAVCLELLEDLPGLVGARVLDLGSGTGVLGIAAVRLGAASALLVDPDPRAVATAREAIRLNGVADRVSCVEGTLAAATGGPFDVVLANVYAHVLMSEVAGLIGRATTGAPVLLSGLAFEQVFEVRQVYEQAGCQMVAERWGQDWVTLRLAVGDRERRRD